MSIRIYAGNLSFDTTQAELETLFGEHGTVSEVHIVTDRETGRSRGFGFVQMEDGGAEAIGALNEHDFGGRRLTVNEARPREERAPRRDRW